MYSAFEFLILLIISVCIKWLSNLLIGEKIWNISKLIFLFCSTLLEFKLKNKRAKTNKKGEWVTDINFFIFFNL